MKGHKEIVFPGVQPEQQAWIIAHLAEAGYDGFEEGENDLKAYVPAEYFDASLLRDLSFKYQLSYTERTIPEQNWNELWESNFQPVIVGDFAAIRASFHEPIANVRHEIVITPKMSFGTGHHATTHMMIQQMKQIDLVGKSVFDFGTGTGILAILAEKMGAKNVVAIDNDDWSIMNAGENLVANKCTKIELRKAEDLSEEGNYDVILANINKNIILANLDELFAHTTHPGNLVLSGLLPDDEVDILSVVKNLPKWKMEKLVLNNWLSIRFESK